MVFVKDKIIAFCQKMIAIIKREFKDPLTLPIFLIVLVVMYAPCWASVLIYFFTGSAVALGVATAYVAFWAGPFTPFFPLCFAISFAIHRFIRKHILKKEFDDQDHK